MNNNDLEQKSTRKKYSPQFKDQALERADKEGIPQVAKDLGLAESLLYSWRAQRKQGGNTLENQKGRFMVNDLQHVIVLKNMCSNILKFITIESDFIRCSVINHRHHLRSKKWLSKMSDFPGQDTIAKSIILNLSRTFNC